MVAVIFASSPAHSARGPLRTPYAFPPPSPKVSLAGRRTNPSVHFKIYIYIFLAVLCSFRYGTAQGDELVRGVVCVMGTSTIQSEVIYETGEIRVRISAERCTMVFERPRVAVVLMRTLSGARAQGKIHRERYALSAVYSLSVHGAI